MTSFRKLFWNYKKSFIGIKMIGYAPKEFLTFPVLAIIPTYYLIQAQKGTKTLINT